MLDAWVGEQSWKAQILRDAAWLGDHLGDKAPEALRAPLPQLLQRVAASPKKGWGRRALLASASPPPENARP
eukprot:1195785-Lingulodinium_polyedra.AAC.1